VAVRRMNIRASTVASDSCHIHKVDVKWPYETNTHHLDKWLAERNWSILNADCANDVVLHGSREPSRLYNGQSIFRPVFAESRLSRLVILAISQRTKFKRKFKQTTNLTMREISQYS
jgi:hypothetical protein